MTLLFDENLSFRLVRVVLSDLPGSRHVSEAGLAQAVDRVIWEHARAQGVAIVTLDSDFYDMTLVHGSPPKVVWLRSADTSTGNLSALLSRHLGDIVAFLADPAVACLILGDAARPGGNP